MKTKIGFLDIENMPLVTNPPGFLLSIPIRQELPKFIKARMNMIRPMVIIRIPAVFKAFISTIGLIRKLGKNCIFILSA